MALVATLVGVADELDHQLGLLFIDQEERNLNRLVGFPDRSPDDRHRLVEVGLISHRLDRRNQRLPSFAVLGQAVDPLFESLQLVLGPVHLLLRHSRRDDVCEHRDHRLDFVDDPLLEASRAVGQADHADRSALCG